MLYMRSAQEMTRFLRDNADQIRDSIKEVFAGSEESQLKGKLVHFDYTEEDCSDFKMFNPRSRPQNYGPGIRIRVSYNDFFQSYFYPEKECPNIESFLDNMNTDFGMSQIQFLSPTNSLKITHYDLVQDTISFKLDHHTDDDEPIVTKGFSTCWNPNTLEFSVDNFLKLKLSAKLKEESEQATRGLTRGSSGFRSKGFHAEAPKPELPHTKKVLGVDKAKFLQKSAERKILK
jgi:hypothetical protein